MNNEMTRGSVFSCLREYVRELHSYLQFKMVIEGADALLGVKGFISFTIIFNELINFEQGDFSIAQNIQTIRVTSQIGDGVLVLKVSIASDNREISPIELQSKSFRIVDNAAKSLGGGACCESSNDGFEWVLDFSLQKISG